MISRQEAEHEMSTLFVKPIICCWVTDEVPLLARPAVCEYFVQVPRSVVLAGVLNIP